MKTVFINGSPKKKLSASGYLLDVQRFFTGGNTVKEKLTNKSDYKRILDTLKDADAVVFCLPLYVDGVPSHVLSFMKEMELFCKDNQLRFNVYAISNSGFIEGNQNKALLQVLENFCIKSGINWCGGIGIGGGVMLNVLRILFFVQIGILLLNLMLSGVWYGNWLPIDALLNFVAQVLLIAFFNLGVFWYTLRMGIAIKRGNFFGAKFTRILIPSFVFIVVADIFFTIISFFKGGIFRGWFRKK